MYVRVHARMCERAPSSGPELRHEVKEMAIGRRCARKRKGETANGAARAARGERKWVKGLAEIGGGRARVRERRREREKRDAWHHVVYWSLRSIHESHSYLLLPTFLPTPSTLPLSLTLRLQSLASLAFPFTLFIHSPPPPRTLLPNLHSPPTSASATNPLLIPNSVLSVALLDRSWRNPVRHPSSCIQRVNY